MECAQFETGGQTLIAPQHGPSLAPFNRPPNTVMTPPANWGRVQRWWLGSRQKYEHKRVAEIEKASLAAHAQGCIGPTWRNHPFCRESGLKRLCLGPQPGKLRIVERSEAR